MFNTHKMVTQVIRGKDINWILGGYHADNGVSATKWEKVNAVINELSDAYK